MIRLLWKPFNMFQIKEKTNNCKVSKHETCPYWRYCTKRFLSPKKFWDFRETGPRSTIILLCLLVYKSIPCISRPPLFGAKKKGFFYFCIRIFYKNLSLTLEFSFRYAMVTQKILSQTFSYLSSWPMNKLGAIFWTDF